MFRNRLFKRRRFCKPFDLCRVDAYPKAVLHHERPPSGSNGTVGFGSHRVSQPNDRTLALCASREDVRIRSVRICCSNALRRN